MLHESVLLITEADTGAASTCGHLESDFPLIDHGILLSAILLLLHYVVGMEAGPVVRDSVRGAVKAINRSMLQHIHLGPLHLFLVELVLHKVNVAFPA